MMVLGGLSLIYLWLGSNVSAGLRQRVPIMENVPPVIQDTGRTTGHLSSFDGVPSTLPGMWPRFRGPRGDAVSRDDTALARQWPQTGPRVLWSVDLGEGYAGPAVRNGRVYVIDYDQEQLGDAIRCFSLDDGREIWRYFYPVKIKRQHGMSRTVPAVTNDVVVTMGPKCHVTCLDARTGELRWGLDLVRDYGARVPPWYAGQCPLIDQGRAIIGVGGEALILAVECLTGRVVWETPNPRGSVMTHSSIVPMTFDGLRTFVYCAGKGVVGVDAADGRLLWEYPGWHINIANVPTPVVVGDDRLFLSGGYNAGSMMLQLHKKGDGIRAEPVYRLGPEVFGAEQQTPILYEDHIYGVRPDEELVCLDLQGRLLWTSKAEHRFGIGPFVIADGLLYVMDDEGVLTLAQADPGGYVQLARARVLEGPDAWGPLAVVHGRLLARDLKRMVCLDIGQE